MATGNVERRLAAIFAADMVGYSRLMEADEEGTIARQRVHYDELINPKIAEFGGRIVKLMGDGLLAEFSSVVDAVRCAVEIQRGMSEREAKVPGERRIQYRVGINLGDIVIDGDDILGDGVNVAARLEGMAKPGGIVISRAARDQIRDKLELPLEDMGEHEVKNIIRPVRAFRVLSDGEVVGTTTPKNPRLERPGRVALIVLACIVLIGAPGIIWLETLKGVLGLGMNDTPGSPTRFAQRPALIVLPFKNLSGDPKQNYFSDGVTEDITTGLARIRGFLVVAKNTAFTFKNKNPDPRALGRALGVRYILQGSARQQDKRLRINAQLIETATGTHVWAERFDRPMKDIFIVQDALVSRIVGSVAARLRRHEGKRAIAASQETVAAYDLTLRARLLFRRNTIASMKEARALLRRAIQKDPKYGPAYAVLAQVEQYFFTSRVSEEYARPETAKRVIAAAARAVSLSPDDAFAHVIYGMAIRMKSDYAGAAREARRARELAPNDPEVLATVSTILLSVGDYKASVETMRFARSLDPYLSPVYIGVILSQSLFALGKFRAAKAAALDCLRRAPRDVRCLESLVRALGELGSKEEAKIAVRKLTRLSPKYTVSEYIRRASKNRQDKAAIKRWADGLRKAGLPE